MSLREISPGMRDYGPDRDFTCGHCRARVRQGSHKRNACPECHWSRHVMFGDPVPCEAMMIKLTLST